MTKLNGSGHIMVGKTKWLEAFDLMVTGEDEDGNATSLTEGPFRSREMAAKFAKAKYRGFEHSTLITFVEERWARFKGLPRKKPVKKAKSKPKKA
jgi:hypothetical protein